MKHLAGPSPGFWVHLKNAKLRGLGQLIVDEQHPASGIGRMGFDAERVVEAIGCL